MPPRRASWATLACLAVGLATAPAAGASIDPRPQLSVSGPLTQSVVPQGTHAIPVTATDNLGLVSVVRTDDTGATKTVGLRTTVPPSWSGDLGPYSTAGLAPGPHWVDITATDEFRQGTTKRLSFTVANDTTAPAIALSGTLHDRRSPATIEPDAYTLRAVATDGAVGASATGVRSVEILIDGSPVVPAAPEPCSAPVGGTCDKTVDHVLNTATVQLGTHTVLVRAVDQAGNASTASFTFTLTDADVDYGTPDDGLCVPDTDSGIDDCADNEGAPADFAAAALTPPAYGLADNNRLPGYIADQGYDTIADPDFRNLGLVQVRRTFPYNIARFRSQADTHPGKVDLNEAVEWVRRTLSAGRIPLIALDKCRTPSPGSPTGATCNTTPDYDDYTLSVRMLLADQSDLDPATKELSDVKLIAAWNEPNQGISNDTPSTPPNHEDKQPLAWINTGTDKTTRANSGAFLAGRFMRYLDAKCRETTPDRCTAVAGEFVDSSMGDTGNRNLVGSRYLSQYRAGYGRVPKAWAWHAYRDGLAAPSVASATDRWKRLRAFIRATVPTNGAAAPPIWLTEQGPQWRVANVPKAMNDQLAARIITCYTSDAYKVSARVRRFYLYQWIGGDKFDSGLRAYNQPGLPLRPLSYDAYAKRGDTTRTC